MTENESRWAERVAEWRASGKTAPDFCEGKGFSPGGLRYWASRLSRGAQGTPRERVRRTRVVGGPRKAVATETPKEMRLARVMRGVRPGATAETPILIEVGAARLGVRRGFDPGTLRAVLDVLGGGR